MAENINVDLNGGVLEIGIERADKKNALTAEMYAVMADALEQAGTDSKIRAVLLHGTDDCFTSGNDLKDFLDNPPQSLASPAFRFIQNLVFSKKPIVAAVNGAAIGIGTTMLLHCDFVYASEDSMFATPFVNLALVPDAASSLLLPKVAGYQQVAKLLLLGDPVGADAALASGFVTEVLPPNKVLVKARETAAKLAAKPPRALRWTREMLRGDVAEMQTVMNREIEHFNQCLASDEAKEALSAFLEKRAPDFSNFNGANPDNYLK